MISMDERLRAAIAAENAPEGYVLQDVHRALEIWCTEGGHFLWLDEGFEEVYFVAIDDTPISSSIATNIVEILREDEEYPYHPSVKSVLGLSNFMQSVD